MTDGDRRVAMQEQQRHRLADDVAASNHDRVTSADWNLLAVEQLDDAGRCARHEHRAFLHEETDIDRRQPVDILPGRNRIEHALLGIGAHRFGQRRLHEDAVVRGAPVQTIDERQRLGDRRRRRQPLEIRAKADLAPRLQLVADVHLGCRVLAHKYDAETRRPSMLRGEGGHLGPDFLLYRLGERPPVQHACAHATTPFSNAFTLSVLPSTTSSSPTRMIASAGGLNSIDPPARLMPTTITPNFWRLPASTMLRLASAESSLMCTCSIDRSSRSELVARWTKSTTAGRSAVCSM